MWQAVAEWLSGAQVWDGVRVSRKCAFKSRGRHATQEGMLLGRPCWGGMPCWPAPSQNALKYVDSTVLEDD
jgi:hypothetical protein